MKQWSSATTANGCAVRNVTETTRKKKREHDEDTLQERWGYTPIVGMYPLLISLHSCFFFFNWPFSLMTNVINWKYGEQLRYYSKYQHHDFLWFSAVSAVHFLLTYLKSIRHMTVCWPILVVLELLVRKLRSASPCRSGPETEAAQDFTRKTTEIGGDSHCLRDFFVADTKQRSCFRRGLWMKGDMWPTLGMWWWYLIGWWSHV